MTDLPASDWVAAVVAGADPAPDPDPDVAWVAAYVAGAYDNIDDE